MKLLMAIVQDEDSSKVLENLNKSNFGATKLSSTGGFLKAGRTTFIIGTEDERVDEAIQVIKKSSMSRKQIIDTSSSSHLFLEGAGMTYPVEVTVGGATIFILNVERIEKV